MTEAVGCRARESDWPEALTGGLGKGRTGGAGEECGSVHRRARPRMSRRLRRRRRMVPRARSGGIEGRISDSGSMISGLKGAAGGTLGEGLAGGLSGVLEAGGVCDVCVLWAGAEGRVVGGVGISELADSAGEGCGVAGAEGDGVPADAECQAASCRTGVSCPRPRPRPRKGPPCPCPRPRKGVPGPCPCPRKGVPGVWRAALAGVRRRRGMRVGEAKWRMV